MPARTPIVVFAGLELHPRGLLRRYMRLHISSSADPRSPIQRASGSAVARLAADQQQQRAAQAEVCFAWQWHVGGIITLRSGKSYNPALAIAKIFGLNRFGAEVICPTFMPQNQQL